MKYSISFIVSLIALSCLSGCVLKSKYEELDRGKDNLKIEADKVKRENELLQAKIDEQKKENEEMQLRNDELSEINQKLVEKNRSLVDEATQVRRKSIKLAGELSEKEKKLEELSSTHQELTLSLKKEIEQGNVKIEELKGMLKLNVVSEILFKSGSHQIRESGEEVLVKVAKSLIKIQGKRIEVQGHTDNVKIRGSLTSKYPTNWELSTARATTVVRILEKQGIDPKLLSAAGYSKYHPVESNDTEEGRQKNRRIEIVLLPLFDK